MRMPISVGSLIDDRRFPRLRNDRCCHGRARIDVLSRHGRPECGDGAGSFRRHKSISGRYAFRVLEFRPGYRRIFRLHRWLIYLRCLHRLLTGDGMDYRTHCGDGQLLRGNAHIGRHVYFNDCLGSWVREPSWPERSRQAEPSRVCERRC
jgi:hypothetical protein